ncbi:MAG: D-2-hydroxyacid dehydrogenase [Pleomorphochaeta sp.]
MKKIKALVLITLNEDEKKMFSQFEDSIDFTFKDSEKERIEKEDVFAAEIIIGHPPKHCLKEATNLKWIQTISSGVDFYLQGGILPKKAIICNAKGSYGQAQSEFMFAMLLSLMKKLHIYRDNQNKALWRDEGSVMVLRDSTALVIGLGDIGSEFAKILKAFGVYVIGVRRDASKECPFADEVHSFKDLDSVIPRVDIIAMVVPSTPESKNLMSKERIALMKENAVLVNTGRGVTVDNEALCDAIENKKIAGAAIDVFDPEPIDKNHRAWNIENLIITPHAAGQNYMEHNWKNTLKLIEINLKLYIEGKELINIVDRDIYEF